MVVEGILVLTSILCEGFTLKWRCNAENRRRIIEWSSLRILPSVSEFEDSRAASPEPAGSPRGLPYGGSVSAREIAAAPGSAGDPGKRTGRGAGRALQRRQFAQFSGHYSC